MNADRVGEAIRQRLPTLPSLLEPADLPAEGLTRFVRPLEDLSEAPSLSCDTVIFDNSLCFSPDQHHLLREARRLLRPGGRLIIGDVVRKRSLPSDLQELLPLWSCGFAQAILLADYPGWLREAGFTDIQLSERPGIDELIARYDLALTEESTPTRPVSEAEWIASTQACCGLGSPRSERLAEILKCDDVPSLWTTVKIVAGQM